MNIEFKKLFDDVVRVVVEVDGVKYVTDRKTDTFEPVDVRFWVRIMAEDGLAAVDQDGFIWSKKLFT